jgi:KDO2-lipid IV(A) lauroyltransferase
MSLKRKIRAPFERGAVHLAAGLIPRLPRSGVLVLARFGGLLGTCFDRRGMNIGRANLDVVFGDTKTLPEKNRILRKSYVTMCQTLLDVFWFAGKPTERLEKYVEIDPSTEVFFEDRAHICMTAHFGNWEIFGQLSGLKGMPLNSIATPVKNQTVDKHFIRAREATGQKIIPRSGALRKLLKVLREGGKTAFLADQNTKESEGGIWISCFGLPAPVTAAPATLAGRTGTEIILGFCEPLPRGRYRVYITDRFQPPESVTDETVRELTEQINAATEREILNKPQHWLWMYKRWKTKRPEDEGRTYPWYTLSEPRK